MPEDIPKPPGKTVTTTTTVDANLNHCLATGRSLTGCLHFVNQTPIDSLSKRRGTVETARYGSEFVHPRLQQNRYWIQGIPYQNQITSLW